VRLVKPMIQTVGIVPPSMTYSLPVMDEARSEARNATNSATSSGRLGRPSGIPPSEFIRTHALTKRVLELQAVIEELDRIAERWYGT